MLQVRRLLVCSLPRGAWPGTSLIHTGTDVVTLDRDAKCVVSPSSVADPADPNRLTQLSGFKQVEQTRKVLIHVPAKNVMQSGTFNKNKWRLKWDNQQRYENPLMGWASSSDPLSNHHLQFSSPAAAADYCVRNGFEYEVVEPKIPAKKVKSYGANFAWSAHTRVVAK